MDAAVFQTLGRWRCMEFVGRELPHYACMQSPITMQLFSDDFAPRIRMGDRGKSRRIRARNPLHSLVNFGL
jgi:hypothetical protein